MKLQKNALHYQSAWTTAGAETVELHLTEDKHLKIFGLSEESKTFDSIIFDLTPAQVEKVYAEVTQLIIKTNGKAERFDLNPGGLGKAMMVDYETAEIVGDIATAIGGAAYGQSAKTGARIGASSVKDLMDHNPVDAWLEALRAAGFTIKLSALNVDAKTLLSWKFLLKVGGGTFLLGLLLVMGAYAYSLFVK